MLPGDACRYRDGHRPREQVLILVENRPEVVSLHMMWDLSCLTNGQVEALLRSAEDVAVEAAFDPDAPAKVSCARDKDRSAGRSG